MYPMDKNVSHTPAAKKAGHPAARGKSAPRGASPRAHGKPAGRPQPAGKSAAQRGKAANPAAQLRGPVKPPVRAYQVNEPSELLAFLLQHVAGEGRNALKSMLSRGQIAVDGTPVKLYNHALRPGQTVTISKERISEKPPLIGLAILHEDDDVIVVVKDAGLLSVSTGQENELTAYRQLTAHVRAADPNSRIFVLHRLDRDTSGVMMFAKSEHVQQQLQHAWQDDVEERTYVALVEGKVKKPEGTITSYLKETKTLKMYSTNNPEGAQRAVTHFKVLQSGSQFSLLELSLETGRKNQIRVHMEDIGHPIVGDKKYGARSKAIGRLGLHARVLAFKHPRTGETLRFETPIPKAFLQPFKENAGPH